MLAPFDPSDPYEAMADHFRKQVADLAIKAAESEDYRELSPHKQIECFMAGVLTGLIGVCFAQIEPQGRAEMMRAIWLYLPQAREQAEGITQSH